MNVFNSRRVYTVAFMKVEIWRTLPIDQQTPGITTLVNTFSTREAAEAYRKQHAFDVLTDALEHHFETQDDVDLLPETYKHLFENGKHIGINSVTFYDIHQILTAVTQMSTITMRWAIAESCINTIKKRKRANYTVDDSSDVEENSEDEGDEESSEEEEENDDSGSGSSDEDLDAVNECDGVPADEINDDDEELYQSNANEILPSSKKPRPSVDANGDNIDGELIVEEDEDDAQKSRIIDPQQLLEHTAATTST